VAGIAPGTHNAVFSKPGYLTQTISSIITTGGVTTLSPTLVVVPRGTLTGTVTASGGAPLQGVTVSVAGTGTVTTLANGTYTVGGIIPGSPNVTFSAAGYTPQVFSSVSIVAGANGPLSPVLVLAPTAVYRPVYRFRNLKNGFYLWSADEAEKNTIITTLYKTWLFEGPAYQINTANPLNQSPLWRFVNIKGGYYLYSADPGEKASIIANLSKTWKFEGEAYKVSTNPAGAPVWRFRNIAKGATNGTYLYSADVNEKNTIVATLGRVWQLEGPAYYLAP
jgi:hypothetical protein